MSKRKVESEFYKWFFEQYPNYTEFRKMLPGDTWDEVNRLEGFVYLRITKQPIERHCSLGRLRRRAMAKPSEFSKWFFRQFPHHKRYWRLNYQNLCSRCLEAERKFIALKKEVDGFQQYQSDLRAAQCAWQEKEKSE
jgi:hypothetical protein